MAINAGDVALYQSKKPDDTTLGGGGPSGNKIATGVSNSIFPDISESDRAAGRVNMRQVFPWVGTNNSDQFLGANVIIATPPQDPKVSVSLFKSSGFFDVRPAAANRIESYLNKASKWPGFLLENHVSGQRAIQICQRVGVAAPVPGKTLCLVNNEGAANQYEQYVRVLSVTTETRTFSYMNGTVPVDYQAVVVTCTLTDALAYDFPGTSATPLFTATTNTQIRDTLVADAAQYYGATGLQKDVAVGDYTAKLGSIFTPIVPASTSETALVDKSLSGLVMPMVAAAPAAITEIVSGTVGGTVTYVLPTGVTPGSLRLVLGNLTITDDGTGNVLAGTAVVGTIVYATGTISFNGTIGSANGNVSETYIPAAQVSMQSYSTQRPVTAENRAYVWVIPLIPLPAPGSITVSYIAQGNRYELQDDSAGRIKGSDSAYGVGTINYVTGSLSVTLGALPDVGSPVMVQWGTMGQYIKLTTQSLNIEAPKLGFDLGSVVAPNSLHLTWTAGGVAKSATDNGAGTITGDATGVIAYGTGVGYIRPTVLPDASSLGVTYSQSSATAYNGVSGGGTTISFTLPSAPIKPKSVSISTLVKASKTVTHTENGASYQGTTSEIIPITITDDGAGNFTSDYAASMPSASINYTTGAVVLVLNKSVTAPVPTYTTKYYSFGDASA